MSSESTEAVVVSRVKRNARPSGFAAYARAIRKYNINSPILYAHEGVVFKREDVDTEAHLSKHPGFHRGASTPHYHTGASTEVPAKDIQSDIEYSVPVTLGTPGITLHLDFDTGSSDLWVWSSKVRASTKGHTIYDPEKSSTSKLSPGSTWSIRYGDGSTASGIVYTDTIKIGSLTIHNQAIELAETLSAELQTEQDDGLMGLAWPFINTVKPTRVHTPVENMITHGLTQGIFSVALDRHDDAGFYSFGAIDAERAGVKESDIEYVDIDNSNGFWMVPSETAMINGKKITQPGNTAILDTGTSLYLASDAFLNEFYKNIPGATLSKEQGGWIYPKGAHVPAVSIAIGDRQYTINPEDIAEGDAGKDMTFGAFQTRGNAPFDLAGDTFLKCVYAVFDQEKARVGLAHRRGNVKHHHHH